MCNGAIKLAASPPVIIVFLSYLLWLWSTIQCVQGQGEEADAEHGDKSVGFDSAQDAHDNCSDGHSYGHHAKDQTGDDGYVFG